MPVSFTPVTWVNESDPSFDELTAPPTSAANLQRYETALVALAAQTLDDIHAPVADVDLNNKHIINLANPTASQNAATRSYVDTADALKANDAAVAHLAGTETVTGDKDFTGALTKSGQATFKGAGGLATILVAASDASADEKARAGTAFTCDGVNDEVQIQSAIDTLVEAGITRGLVQKSHGTFKISNKIKVRRYVNIQGSGEYSTVMELAADYNPGPQYSTTLNNGGSLSSSATSVTLTSTANIPPAGQIQIENEVITYDTKSGNVLSGLVRGENGTTAASHADGLAVNLIPGMYEVLDDTVTRVQIGNFTINGKRTGTGAIGANVHSHGISLVWNNFSADANGFPDPLIRVHDLFIFNAKDCGIAALGGMAIPSHWSFIRSYKCAGHGIMFGVADSIFVGLQSISDGHCFMIFSGNGQWAACRASLSGSITNKPSHGYYVAGSRNVFSSCGAQDTGGHGWLVTKLSNYFSSCYADNANKIGDVQNAYYGAKFTSSDFWWGGTISTRHSDDPVQLITVGGSGGAVSAPAAGTTETWVVSDSFSDQTGTPFVIGVDLGGGQTEMVYVSNVSGNTWTVQRGWNGYGSKTHRAGDTTTGNTTNNSPTVTGIASTANMLVGQVVTGSGISIGTIILSIDSASQITLSKNATATATGVTLTTGAALYNRPTPYAYALASTVISGVLFGSGRNMARGILEPAGLNWTTSNLVRIDVVDRQSLFVPGLGVGAFQRLPGSTFLGLDKAAPIDADLSPQTIYPWIDEVNHVLAFRSKESGGTLKSYKFAASGSFLPRSVGHSYGSTSSAWSGVNDSFYIPIFLPVEILVLTGITIHEGASTAGNWTVALLDSTGKVLIKSAAAAFGASGIRDIPFTATYAPIPGGYFVGISGDNVGLLARGVASNIATNVYKIAATAIPAVGVVQTGLSGTPGQNQAWNWSIY